MRRPVALALVLSVALAACSDGDAAGCTELREPLDPASTLHVVDPSQATFLTDPPTSGPHTTGPAAAGRLEEPLPPAAQVRVLEGGGAVVQFADATDADRLAPLLDVSPAVVLAPGSELPAAVVATAWTWKLTCGSPDLEALQTFVEERPASAPGLD